MSGTDMGKAVLLACDWGTTNLRAWTLDAAGAVVAEADLPLGVSKLGPGEAHERFEKEVRPALNAQSLPAILCGMVGSNLGWKLAPYVDCPADFANFAHAAIQVAPDVQIIPGLRCAGLTGAPDVMRGEETQVLGWLAQNPERWRGRHLICHPGTHAKWVVVEEGRIVRFVTAMTGEIFAMLSRHSILKSDAPPNDEAAFAAGLAAAADGNALAARLFSARSRVVGGDAKANTTPSYLSGLLIGAEIASLLELLGSKEAAIILLGDAVLCDLYRRALERRDMASESFDGKSAAIAGLFALHRTGFPT
jgi:2-dehydro-3-deoxygalactonokinase